MLDEETPDVVGGSSGWELVERLVSQRGMASEFAQGMVDVRLADPRQPAVGSLHRAPARTDVPVPVAVSRINGSADVGCDQWERPILCGVRVFASDVQLAVVEKSDRHIMFK